jgi:hypothetical protein
VKYPKGCPTDGNHGDVTQDYSCLVFPSEFEECGECLRTLEMKQEASS